MGDAPLGQGVTDNRRARLIRLNGNVGQGKLP